MRQVRWHLRMAALIPEPRLVRAFHFAGYLVLLLLAVACLIQPLSAWEGTVGAPLTYVWAAIVTVGAAACAASVLTIYWAVERIGIGLAAGGLAVYGMVTVLLQLTDGGNRLPQVGLIVFTLLMLALRFVRIRGAIVEPGR